MSDGGFNQPARYLTAFSSLALRACAYIFLRWIPGQDLPPFIYTFIATYVPAFIYSLTHTPPFRIISDEVDIVTRETIDPDDAAKDVDPRYADQANPGAELDVEETVVVEERDSEILKTLITGLPSPTSLFWSSVTFFINVALVLMALDLIYTGPTFYPSHDLSLARVGYVSHDTARILVREPSAAQYPIFASYRHADSPVERSGVTIDTAWKASGRLDWLDDSTDHTGTFMLTHLKPDTRYQYVVSNNHTGHFTTAPRPGHTSTKVGKNGIFTFLHSSCLKNNVPYIPFRHPLTNTGLKYLSEALDGLKAQFMLFLGDFIYIDVPRRLGSTAEDYRREYRQVYASPEWSDATKDLPWIHVYVSISWHSTPRQCDSCNAQRRPN